MKNYLILNNFYNTIRQINEKTFIGLIENVKGEKEALNRAKYYSHSLKQKIWLRKSAKSIIAVKR